MGERRTMSEYRQKLRREAQHLIGEPLLDLPAIKSVDESDKVRRAAQMSILYHDNGWSLERVGQAYALSRERVRQIFTAYNLPTRSPLGDSSYSRPFDRLVVESNDGISGHGSNGDHDVEHAGLASKSLV